MEMGGGEGRRGERMSERIEEKKLIIKTRFQILKNARCVANSVYIARAERGRIRRAFRAIYFKVI